MSLQNPRFRNIAISLIAVIAILCAGLASPPQSVYAQATDFSFSPLTGSLSIAPGQTATFTTALASRSASAQTYTITTNIASFPGWTVTVNPSAVNTVAANSSLPIALVISAPASAAQGTVINLQLTATRQSDGVTSGSTITITVAQATATPTRTIAPTGTIVPTSTISPGCPEAGVIDPGGSFDGASELLVDLPENHGICSRGDEDWFKFGGVAGKVYTIDIDKMDAGLDLSLELFGPDRQRITANDDFYLRDPARPNPSDIRPRIQSIRLLDSGLHYIRVRDTLNIGGRNRTYSIIVRSESYGPTPATVAEICRDLFEDDGLPEQGKLITANELQQNRRLCPIGDADWVRFFGKTGKTFYLYTDTRPYRNNPDINNQTLAGADTIITLFDRDGQTQLDFNDDIDGSLDSQIRFVPRVDGFYYAQIKNTGDIGNQFVRYDLLLELCLPEEECGRAPAPATGPTAAAGGTITPVPFSSPTPTATFQAAATQTLAPTVTGTTSAFIAPTPLAQQPAAPVTLANVAFDRLWARTDALVASGRLARGWIWGPRALATRTEEYREGAVGSRAVQYYDKGRMEQNDPASAAITSGLLARELVTGQIQIGNETFVVREAANLPLVGDERASSPTYADMAAVAQRRFADRSGRYPVEKLLRGGGREEYTGPLRRETILARFDTTTGHNVPQVFVDFFLARGPIEDGSTRARLVDAAQLIGAPLTEAYWISVIVDGAERDVLVQVFERRVLTYTPDAAASWQVQMNNIGRDYYRWRYGEALP